MSPSADFFLRKKLEVSTAKMTTGTKRKEQNPSDHQNPFCVCEGGGDKIWTDRCRDVVTSDCTEMCVDHISRYV